MGRPSADPVRVVVLGNSFAAKAQLPALRWAGGNEVVAIAGRDEEKARRTAREWSVPTATGDWRECLRLEPELVLVTTPVHLHHEMALAALRATGAAVLCEKPFALDATEAAELVRAAEGRQAWLDHQLRWSPALRELRRRVRSGALGEPRHAQVDLLFPPRPGRPWSWWYDAERGGGVLGALGSHLVDLVRWTLGEVDRVQAQLATVHPERADADGRPHRVTADESATLLLRAGGVPVDVRTAVEVPYDRGFVVQVTGTDGTARVVDAERLLVGGVGDELAPVDLPPLAPRPEEIGLAPMGAFALCLPHYLRDVVRAVRDGGELPEAATFADGLATQRVLDAARASSEGHAPRPVRAAT